MSKKRKSKESYNVGYKKPPKNTQFKKGESGNVKGRPKKTNNFSEVLQDILNEEITITMNGNVIDTTYMKAFVRSILNLSMKGQKPALDFLKLHLQTLEKEEDQKSLKVKKDKEKDISREVGELFKKIANEKGKPAHEKQALEIENNNLKKELEKLKKTGQST